MNLFSETAKRIRRSHLLIPVYIAFVALFIVSGGLSIEDLRTNLEGYKLLPTLKIGGYVAIFVALLPQLGQITFFYLWGSDSDIIPKRYSGLITLGLFFLDCGLDSWFKCGGQLRYLPVSIAESILVFTLGSEFALTISFSTLCDLFPDFWKRMGVLKESVLVTVFEGGGNSNESNGKRF